MPIQISCNNNKVNKFDVRNIEGNREGISIKYKMAPTDKNIMIGSSGKSIPREGVIDHSVEKGIDIHSSQKSVREGMNNAGSKA